MLNFFAQGWGRILHKIGCRLRGQLCDNVAMNKDNIHSSGVDEVLGEDLAPALHAAALQIIQDQARADDDDALLDAFLASAQRRGLQLYSAQEEAILELMAGQHLILNTPTGSGKSLVAEALHFRALAKGQRSIYTAPIKALVSEKFFALCDLFGAKNVGMLTGDASINRDAPILCCTAEILSNICLRQAENAPVDVVIMDEFHYFADRDRGIAWQVPLLILRDVQYLLMSATLGDVSEIKSGIEAQTGRELTVVRSVERPVPLDFSYSERPLHETIDGLVKEGKAPIYLVNFTQRECAEQAQNLLSVNFLSKEDKRAIRDEIGEFRFDSAFGKQISKLLYHGLGLHHAGLLPKYRRLVERLAQKGWLKVISGTDSLGVGVNVPIRTVLFTKLCKYDGEKTRILSVRDFKQISGRAGRKGFDEAGSVVCQAPEHVIENKKLEEKLAAGKKKKIVKKRPPERNFVNWDAKTFARLHSQDPEALRSQFSINHGLLLNLLQGAAERQTDGYRDLLHLIQNSHESQARQKKMRRQAAQLFRSLREAGIISVLRNNNTGTRVVVNTDLQQDFSLNHSLSLYLYETLAQRPGDDETSRALAALSMVEAILDDPRVVLKKQLDKLFVLRLAELKAEGLDYDARMEELQKLEHPKPLADFIYPSFNEFVARHPWVEQDNIKPKGIAREMFENFWDFHDYVREYGLAASEGVLLRYLSDCYKTLVQNVPIGERDDSLAEIVAFLRGALAAVDSSLVSEWEQLLNPIQQALPEPQRQRKQARRLIFDPHINPAAFRAKMRTEMHFLLAQLAWQRFGEASRALRVDAQLEAWDADRIKARLDLFIADNGALVFNHQARLPEHIFVEQVDKNLWRLRQVLLNEDGPTDWMLEAEARFDPEMSPDDPLLALVSISV